MQSQSQSQQFAMGFVATARRARAYGNSEHIFSVQIRVASAPVNVKPAAIGGAGLVEAKRIAMFTFDALFVCFVVFLFLGVV